MHIVLLKEPIRNLTIERFPESIEQMHGCVQIPVVPRPVKLRISLPFIPGIAASRLSEKAAFEPIVVGAPGHLVGPLSGELKHELIQISHPGQPSPCPDARLQLVLKAQINTARALTPVRQYFLKLEAVFFCVLVYSGCSASRFPSARSD